MPAKPMLDDVELQLIQKLTSDDQEVLAEHGVPALEGDFLQDLGRRVTRVSLTGVMTGTEAGDSLKTLREKFRAAAPVTFVADIATATKVGKVLIEELGVRELAGKPERFEYELTLREFLPPPKPEQEEPPPPPEPELPDVETGTLIVEVTVEGQPAFDFSKVTLTVKGAREDGTELSQTLTNRSDNVWTEEQMALGRFTVEAVVTDPPALSGSTPAAVQAGATTRSQINLNPGAIIAKTFVAHFRFDNAFLEPCMREVAQRVAHFAAAQNDHKLLIVGNTDEVGSPTDLTASDPYNQSLSERRARSAFAYSTFGTDANASKRDWKALRQAQAGLPTLGDKWGARQYQYMLQALGFYPGNIDGDHGPLTSDAVRSFREAKGLPPGSTVDEAVWDALIADYLAQGARPTPGQFLPNANAANGCDGGILKWLGLASQDPVNNIRAAHRPNRRAEFLFVRTDRFPDQNCRELEPDTFNLPSAGAVNPTWCLGPGSRSTRTCFVVKHLPAGGQPQGNQWVRQPAEPGTVTVRGSIKFEDGTPAPNVKYVLIAPDGEFMDGEQSSGEGIRGRTRADGTFDYPSRPKGVGTYTMEIEGPFIARLEGEPISAAKGSVVCKLMDGSSNFNVVVRSLTATVNPQITLASPFVVVKKKYTDPARQVVTVRTDGPFFRSGKVNRVGTAIRFFDAAVDGTEITFNDTDNVFTGSRLTAGVQLFAESETPSTFLGDVELTLTLTPGATPIGPSTSVTMTAVELTMDIFMTRTVAGVDPAPLPQPAGAAPGPGPTDKWFAGRPVHVRSGTRGKRALLIVRETKPPAFDGTLLLRQVAVNGLTVGGLDTKAQLFDTETGGAAKGNSHEFNGPVPAAGKRFFVEGATVSGGLRDTGFQVGIKGSDNDGDRIALTVFKVDKVEVKLAATPCKRDGSRADPMPAKVSIADSRTFDATTVTVVKECGDLKLTATVTPAAVPITWDTERAADDKGLAGLPTHNADPAAAADDKKRVLKADATGSFHVHAFVDVNRNNKRGDDEDGIILNVNMVNVEFRAVAGNNQILTKDNLFNKARSSATKLVVDSGSTGGTGPGVNAVYGDAEFTKHAIGFKAIVKLTGGGANQLRGTTQIGLGYIQQTPSDNFTGTYAPGKTFREVIVADTTIPPSAANRLKFPVRDARGESFQNTGPFGNSSSDSDKSPIAAGGEQRVVRFIDSPGIGLKLTHPTGSALTSISGSNDFEIFLSAFSNDFDENYTVIATAAWSITYGTFTAAAGWTTAGAHVTAPGAVTAPAKATPGASTKLERCPPNFVDNLRMDPN